MSEQFKGRAGGDPSRRPPLVTVHFHCIICNKPGSGETKRPNHFQTPKTCSTDCASALARKEAEELIRSVLGGNNAPQSGSISQRMAEEVLTASNWMEQAEKGRVRKINIICAHCGHAADNFTNTLTSNKNVSRFCSWECKASNSEGLPAGVICRSPKKFSHATFEESQLAATAVNAQLLLAGDMEGVTPYLCSCGSWHVGHDSKNGWLLPAQAAIAFMSDRTMALIQQRKNLRRGNK